MKTAAEIITEHEAAGRYFEAGGARSFVREEGTGETVLCFHGVPASSFLYRKVIRELAARGLRGVSFDLPGLGLAARPRGFDYSWTGLGRFSAAAIDALGLDRFHLVVHDLGGPVGLEVARRMPERVQSLTILDTILDPATFHRPFPMWPFAVPVLGWVWLRSMNRPLYRALWYRSGIHDPRAMEPAEIDAYFSLLMRGDNGLAFLDIMRGFELTPEKSEHYRGAVQGVPYPVQIVWGEHDNALTLAKAGRRAEEITGVTAALLPGGHFLQEEQAPELADLIRALANRARKP